MKLFEACKKSTILFGESIGEEALLSGVSDVLVIKYPNGTYKSTPFLACFGTHSVLCREVLIELEINEQVVIKTHNSVNRHGYMKNVYMTQEQIQSMKLHFGRNTIKYKLEGKTLQTYLYLLRITDKILISDFDGTLTINDFGGLLGGIFDYDAVQPGYPQLLKKLSEKGVYIIWVTMRSLPFYDCTKRYGEKYIGVDGVLLMEPEEFLPAVKKELFKKTGNIKANIIKKIADLFPKGVYSLVGGLGNRENDAIAYLNIGMKIENIYLVSSSGYVQRMSSSSFGLTYKKMAENPELYFTLQTYFY